jgi:hypothetical protein
MNVLKSELIAAMQFDKSSIIGLEGCEAAVQAFTDQAYTAWSMVSGKLTTGDVVENTARRSADLASTYFTSGERIALAKSIIRHHDTTNAHHCSVRGCGDTCEWRLTKCTNEECEVVVSQRWLQKHDDVCPQKIVPCDRYCGEMMYRRLVPLHMTSTCPLRPVECPFMCLGCVSGK